MQSTSQTVYINTCKAPGVNLGPQWYSIKGDGVITDGKVEGKLGGFTPSFVFWDTIYLDSM